MTSRQPPSQRNRTSIEHAVRHNSRGLLSQGGPGFLAGRFATAQPVPGGSWVEMADDSGSDGPESDQPMWEASDFHLITAADVTAGYATIALSQVPITESLVLWWRTVAQQPSAYGVDEEAQQVTVPLEDFCRAGDPLWVHYAYRAGLDPTDRAHVPLGAIWAYKTGLGGSAATYADPAFDDSAWPTGPSPFGGGGAGGIATVVPSPMNVWTRVKITTLGGDLTFSAVQVDNNAYVYLDGTLIWSPAYPGIGATITVPCEAGDHTIAIHGTDDGVGGRYCGFDILEHP